MPNNIQIEDEEINECIQMQEVSRDFRTEIPNIVFELLNKRKISPYAFLLYSVYRRTAGEHGKCWKGFRKLSEESQLSLDTIHKARIELQQSFPELGGKSLIKVQKGDNTKNQSDTVLIMDIWRPNHAYFKKYITCSYSEHHPFAIRTPCSPGEQKKEPCKKEPYKNITSDEAIGLATFFYETLKRLNPGTQPLTPANLKTWAEKISLMIRIDKRTPEEIKKSIEFLEWDYKNRKSDFFWLKSVQSPDKLRKHYGALFLAMQNLPKQAKEEKQVELKIDNIKKNKIIAIQFKDKIKNDLKHNYKIDDNAVFITTPRKQFIPLGYNENGFYDQLNNILRKYEML